MVLVFSYFLSSGTDVVPEVVETVLPFRSASVLMPEFFFTAAVTLITKYVGPNETCFWRSTLFVVEPHSMSIVPFCSSGMRFDEVTGCRLTLRSGILSSALTASTTFMQRSIAYPIGCCLSSRYENGMDDSR